MPDTRIIVVEKCRLCPFCKMSVDLQHPQLSFTPYCSNYERHMQDRTLGDIDKTDRFCPLQHQEKKWILLPWLLGHR